jgi:hypothetical protein
MFAEFDLDEIKKRANAAALQDGLMEVFMGLFLVFFGGSMTTNVAVGIPFIVLAIFFTNPMIERIKVRYIYPRIGYVKLPPDPKTTGKGIAAAAVLFVVVLLGAMGISMGLKGKDAGLEFFMTYIVPPSSGFMLGIGPFWLGQTYGLFRGYLWATLFVLGGIAMPLFRIASGYEAVWLLCTVVGLLILIVGIVLILRFLLRYPAAEGEAVTDAR